MIRKCLLFFLLCYSHLSVAQDLIYTLQGEEIKSKVLEIGLKEIRYKQYDFQQGPVYVLSKSEVYMIHYEAGHKEFFYKKQDSRPAYPENRPYSTEMGVSNYPLKKEGFDPKQTFLKRRILYIQPSLSPFGIMIGAGYEKMNARYKIGYRYRLNYTYMGSNLFDGTEFSAIGTGFDLKFYLGKDPTTLSYFIGPRVDLALSPDYGYFALGALHGLRFMANDKTFISFETFFTIHNLGLSFNVGFNF